MAKRSDPVARYARSVVSGKTVAGPWVRKACARHLDDVKHAKERGLVWDLDRALRAIQFFPDMLQLEDGAPFVLLPWQQFVIGSLFGWYNSDGTRRFRTAYVETGKGSGKTPLAAGIGLYGLTADGQAAAEIYSAATARDQASIVFRDAVRMRNQNPELAELIKEQVGSLSIPSTFSVFRAVSSEHRGLDGKRVHMAIVDELHEHPSSIVVDKMRAGTKAQRNALIFEITNSGYDRESVCYRHREYSEKVLDGIFENDQWFAYVCALDDGDDWTDPKVWAKANPSLGVTIPESYLREQVNEALGMPSKQNIVKRLNFCVWTEQADLWMPMDKWDACAGEVDPESLRGRICYAGLDLSSTTDLSSLVLYFPGVDGGRDAVLPFFWIPGDEIQERERRDHVPYLTWIEQGLLEATPGPTINYDAICHRLDSLVRDSGFLIQEVAFDRWGATKISQDLMDAGFEMVQFGQGYASMSAPMKELARLVLSRGFDHGGHPILRWNASNVSAAQDPAGNIKPDKRSSKARIDGIVALIMALDRAQRHAIGESEYERRAREEAVQTEPVGEPPEELEAPPTEPRPARRRSIYDSPEWQETNA